MGRTTRDVLAGVCLGLILLGALGGIVALCEKSGEVRGYYPRGGRERTSVVADYFFDFDRTVGVFADYQDARAECNRLNAELEAE